MMIIHGINCSCTSWRSNSRNSSQRQIQRQRRRKYNYFDTFLYYQQSIGVSLILGLVLVSNFGTFCDTSYTTSSSSSSNNNNLNNVNNGSGSSFYDSSSSNNRNSINSGSSSTAEDNLRKELIKIQILSRLGLSEKPQVDLAHKISRDLVLETLRRTETLDEVETRDGILTTSNRFQHHRRHHNHSRSSSSSNSDEDVAYAKTSEIISFPEKGPELNSETLLSFSFAGTNAFGIGVRVKKAHLWVKMDHRSPIGRQLYNLLHPKGVTLYIFQVQGNFTNQTKMPSFLRTQDVTLDLVVSKTVTMDSLGWQKLDVTSIVQKWYNKISRHKIRHGHGGSNLDGGDGGDHGKNMKLTLLVDCSGCGYTIRPITFTRQTVYPSPPSSLSSTTTEANTETENDNNVNNSNNYRSTSYLQQQQNELDEQQQVNNSKLSHHHSHHHHHYASATDAFESFPDYEHFLEKDSSSSSSSSSTTDHLDNLSEIPFLVLETETASPSIKRSRRRALECSPRVKQCCKQRFFISFAELGWQDWIIAPRGYYANYCRGHCGGAHRTPDTFLNYHTHVMEEYRRTAAGEVELNGIAPCCAPTKFAAMSLIYFGPELNIIKRDLPKMIIEECGCP